MSSRMETKMHSEMEPKMLTDDLGIDEPQNWALTKKISVSLAASGYTFALLYGATCYTAGVQQVAMEFDVSSTKSFLPFSLYIWGIFFAPIYSPHISERIGRNRLYAFATLGLGAFTLGAAYSKTFVSLAICRFFAGLFGGSNAVQIEGTFADVWPALFTTSYYPFLICAQYFGAATGAIIGWHVVPETSWRWTQYTTLMFVLGALLLGVGVPETYRRELVRRRAKKLKQPSPLEPAQNGVTFVEMAKTTLINPLIMAFKDPLVGMIGLYLGLNFGVLFSWFISVPIVLQTGPGYTPQQVGSAFSTALGGTAVAAILSVAIDQVVVRLQRRRLGPGGMVDIELRLISAMIGAALLTASLFWIGWTANPNFHPMIPIAGNGIYVTGSAMIVIGFISYLFDAYKPEGILTALTFAACFRLAWAGAIPLLIVPVLQGIGGMWGLSTFGFISIAFLPFPFIIFLFGKRIRMRSVYYDAHHMSPIGTQMESNQKHSTDHGMLESRSMDA